MSHIYAIKIYSTSKMARSIQYFLHKFDVILTVHRR